LYLNQLNHPTSIKLKRDYWEIPNHLKKILLIISKSIYDNHIYISLLEKKLHLTFSNLEIYVRHGIEPTSIEVDKIVSTTSDDIDAIIAIGGGSIIDIAKFVALLKISGGMCAEYEFSGREIVGCLPTFVVPSTAGTGSEVTQYSVIKNSNTHRKFTIANSLLFPHTALMDPVITIGLPIFTTIATGLDAFIHCLESILKPNVNQLVRPIAIEGLKLIYNNLPKIINEPDNIGLREQLQYASLLGGICISHSRTGLIHTLSAAFSVYSSQAHGILNAQMMPFVLNYNSKYYDGHCKNIVKKFVNLNIKNDEDAINLLINFVNGLLKKADSIKITGDIDIAEKDNLIERVLQDKGVNEVNHRSLPKKQLGKLINEIINEIR
jgi:alcohol dehydrogenase class IV